MKKAVFTTLLVLSFLIVGAHAIQAQGGGKAEPNRVEFKRGTHSSTLKGKVKGDEQAEYVFGASAGQAITVDVTSAPAKAITIELHTSNGDSVELQSPGTHWTGNLPETGDYLLYVKRANASPRRASYVVSLSIN